MKFKFFSMLAVTATLITVAIFGTADAGAVPVLDKKSADFRDLQGFSKDPDVLKKAKSDAQHNNSETTDGVALTDEEKQELVVRVKLSREIGGSIVHAAKEGIIDGFAGLYMDTPRGKLMVGLVHVDQQDKVLALVSEPYRERIEFFKADYSHEELQKQMDVLNSKIEELQKEGLQVNAFGISVKDNRIEVELPAGSEQAKSMIKKVVDEKYLVFRVTVPYRAMAATDKIRPVMAGIEVSNSNECSSGYVTYGPPGSNSYYVVTAGHCVSNGSTLYQPTFSLFSSNSIGTVTKWSGGGSNADAAAVLYSNATAYQVYPNISMNGYFAPNEYGVQVGDTIHTVGEKTGNLSGAVTNIDKTITIFGIGTLYHQRTANIAVQGGDSGGAIYGQSIYDNKYYNEGIVSGGTGSSVSYSQIYNIIGTLGI